MGGTAERWKLAERIIHSVKYLDPQRRAEKVESLLERARVELPDDLMMSSEQVRRLHDSGMEIGAHTHSHPILARLDDKAARIEIGTGKELLEEIIADNVRLFAYPNGKPGTDYTEAQRDIVAAMGFDAAVSTRWGAARAGTDLFQLPRFTPWHTTPSRFHMALVRNYLT